MKDNKENSLAPIDNDNTNGQKKKKTWNGSKITYYSYNKKGHFASNYIKPKTSCSFRNLQVSDCK